MATGPTFTYHVTRMFRDEDVEAMSFMFDLRDYSQVKTNADDILKCLKGEGGRRVMPPASKGGPWPSEWIALFERWINEGHKE